MNFAGNDSSSDSLPEPLDSFLPGTSFCFSFIESFFSSTFLEGLTSSSSSSSLSLSLDDSLSCFCFFSAFAFGVTFLESFFSNAFLGGFISSSSSLSLSLDDSFLPLAFFIFCFSFSELGLESAFFTILAVFCSFCSFFSSFLDLLVLTGRSTSTALSESGGLSSFVGGGTSAYLPGFDFAFLSYK